MVISSLFSLGRFGTHYQAGEHPALLLGRCMSAGRGEPVAFLSPWGSASSQACPDPLLRSGEGRSRLRCSCPVCRRPCRAEGQAAPQLLLLPRGQRSPSGNRVQRALERSQHKPGKRPNPSFLLLPCFCSHAKQG